MLAILAATLDSTMGYDKIDTGDFGYEKKQIEKQSLYFSIYLIYYCFSFANDSSIFNNYYFFHAYAWASR